MLPIRLDEVLNTETYSPEHTCSGLFNLYQPIVELETNRMVGVETLMRKTLGDGVVQLPGVFIPTAELDGSIQTMGRHAVLGALEEVVRWQIHAPDRYVTVNVSAAETDDPEYAIDILDMIEKTGANPARVCLELTESLPFDSLNSFRNLHLLQNVGIRIFLDDFGTGHSSMAALARLPISGIKIPIQFTSLIAHSELHQKILRNMLSLAHSSGLDAIVEGIETEAQRAMLIDMGARLGQGFLMSPPLHASEL